MHLWAIFDFSIRYQILGNSTLYERPNFLLDSAFASLSINSELNYFKVGHCLILELLKLGFAECEHSSFWGLLNW